MLNVVLTMKQSPVLQRRIDISPMLVSLAAMTSVAQLNSKAMEITASIMDGPNLGLVYATSEKSLLFLRR